MKKLPSIYHKDINRNISNNQEVCYAREKMDNNISNNINSNINDFIDALFREDGYIFNKPLIITTKNKNYNTAIVKKSNNKIFTLTDDIIDISDIISIKRIK